MNIPQASLHALVSKMPSRSIPGSGTEKAKSKQVDVDQLKSTRQEEFEAADTLANVTFPKYLSNERAKIPKDATLGRSEARSMASTLESMVAISSRPVTGEKVTVSATGALFMENETQPKKAWEPSSLSQAVDYRKSCIEKHKQTIEVLVDARAQPNVPESHLKTLEQAMLAADKKVFAAMKMCDQFRD